MRSSMLTSSLPDSQLALHKLDSISLAFVLFAGRVALAWLPPGSVGRHNPARLGVTLAASAVLGLLVSLALGPLPPLFAWGTVLLGLGLRIVSLPGAMVPRHEPPLVPASRGTRALRSLLVLALVILFAQAMGWIALSAWSEHGENADVRPVVVAAGILLLMIHGAHVARRSPTLALLLTLLFFVNPTTTAQLFASPDGIESSFFVAAGAAFTIPWLRRADRRARMLAIAAFTALATSGQPALGLAGVSALLSFTPRASLASTLRLVAMALFFVLVLSRDSLLEFAALPSVQILATLREFVSLEAYPHFALLALLGLLLYAGKRGSVSADPNSTRREAGAAYFALFATVLACAWSSQLLLPLSVLAYFAVLLSLIPREQPRILAGVSP